MKYILSLITAIFLGCGGSSDGVSTKNPYSLDTFDPYSEPGFKYAWHLRVVESDAFDKKISSLSHVNIYEAWKYTRGKGIKIAIIDYDFNDKHPDIAGNVLDTFDVETNSMIVKKNISSHGTMVASIIAAGKNDYGILGVAPEASLILITADLTKNDQKVAAFKKAKELGADVICCSWEFINNVSDELKDTIKENYQSGIVTIFASGNNSLDLGELNDLYDNESELPWVIGVGASTEYNTLADYSNYGENLDILAPAGSLNFGLYADDYEKDTYKTFSGTSAAAPVVAGVVALIKSVNPNLTPDEVRDILISTADKIEPDKANYINGFSHTHAYGKVNASAAVAKAVDY